MLKDIFLPSLYSEKYENLIKDICSGAPTAAFGVGKSNKSAIISILESQVIYIVKDNLTAKEVVEDLNNYGTRKFVYLPAKDDVIHFKTTINKERIYDRLSSLFEIINGASCVTTFDSLMQLFPKDIKFITLEKGKEYDLYNLAKVLVGLGYKREEYCEERGTFSIKGDRLEIYPINESCVYRVEFFGDEVESIRVFGESTEKEKISVINTNDSFCGEDELDNIKQKLFEALSLYKFKTAQQGASKLYFDIREKIENGNINEVSDYLFPILYNSTHDFSKFFTSNAIVIFDEAKFINEYASGYEKENVERILELEKRGECLSFVKKQIAPKEYVLAILKKYKQASLQSLNSIIPFFNPIKTYSFNSGIITRYAYKFDGLISDLLAWQTNGYTVCLYAGNSDRQIDLNSKLLENGINSGRSLNKTYSVYVFSSYLQTGFISHDNKMVYIGTNDLYLKNASERKVKSKRNKLFTAPQVGDYVVHEVFGIGRAKGIKRLSVLEGEKDYVEIEYAGGDLVFVGADSLDRLSKYLGSDEAPKLSRIDNGEFERIKERVRASIAKLTINLKKLYKERSEKVGFEFLPDGKMTEDFIQDFPYEDTEDQISSWDEIKADMESRKVMDRLLCGDVGFGKTEIAFRAAFKAIASGKQVAFIAPTTILSQQHYLTAIERYKNFGIRIEVINRFRTSIQIRDILENTKQGKVDMLIGTHRLLSKDVEFKDLGLLIVDEEQRFGVEQKEKIRDKYRNIDSLSLSATPIPRTLNMSLSGIRDISTINTPPKQRIPVQVQVQELTDELIKDAIDKELSRKGQVFILYNRVETISTFAARVRDIEPNARIIVAHGQLPEKELEDKIMQFYNGEGDILIATTIIENGIDIPKANTLIVVDSDRLGLATLYQLKGRVGRGSHMAYAYFTYGVNKVLSEEAYKRLTALSDFSEMGSGYKIALRDLEIRGAGNVLGAEQHGHMERIGYELYGKLLKEELGEYTKNQEVELEIKIDAYIPEKYIDRESTRMDVYKQIADIDSMDEYNRLYTEITNLFGEIPLTVEKLFKISLLKLFVKKAEGIKIKISLKNAKVMLKGMESLADGKLMARLNEFKGKAILSFEDKPIISFTTDGGRPDDELELMLKFFEVYAKNN